MYVAPKHMLLLRRGGRLVAIATGLTRSIVEFFIVRIQHICTLLVDGGFMVPQD